VMVNLISQSTMAVGSNAHAAMAKDIGTAMLDSTAALVAMLGIVRLIEQLLQAPQWVREVDARTGQLRPVELKHYTLWALARTLLSHSCWRHFPTLSVRLPEILLGGTFKGVPLQSLQFDEPRTTVQSAVGDSMGKKAAILERRAKRFQATRGALERLLHFTRMERKLMMKRLLGWAPGEEILFANCAGIKPRMTSHSPSPYITLHTPNKKLKFMKCDGALTGAQKLIRARWTLGPWNQNCNCAMQKH